MLQTITFSFENGVKIFYNGIEQAVTPDPKSNTKALDREFLFSFCLSDFVAHVILI